MSTPKIESWMEAAAEEILSGADYNSVRFHGPNDKDQWCWQYRDKECVSHIIARHAPSHPAGVAELVSAAKTVYDYESRRSSPDTAWDTPMMTKLREAISSVESTPPDSLSAELAETLEGMLGNYIELKTITLAMARSDASGWVGARLTPDDDIHVIAARAVLRKYDEAK